jgi:thymidylate synthase
MSLNVNDIPAPVPAIWQSVANDDGIINSNYGWAIFHKDNYYQYENVANELRTHPDSRRAVMIYTRPKMWIDYCATGINDFICTNTVHYMIRDSRLHAIVSMRSNDAVFGYKNDYAWQMFVFDKLSKEINVLKGDMHWNANSLHVYSRHYGLII